MNRVHVENLGYLGMRMMAVYVFQERGDDIYIQRQATGVTPDFVFLRKASEFSKEKPEASFMISFEDARQLVDALNGQGFMPGEVAQIKGELKATKKHLKDMRRLSNTLGDQLFDALAHERKDIIIEHQNEVRR